MEERYNKNRGERKMNDKRTLPVRRVAKVTKGGKRLRFSTVVVVGDRAGSVGVALGRGADVKSAVEKFIKFRRNMGLGLDFGKARYIWGKKEIKVLEGKEVDFIKRREENLFVNEKVSLVEENVKKLLLFKWVKFIGVSGSVAAGFAKDEDDIDLFIVVKDGTAWLYRGVLTLRGLFNGLFRGKRHGEDVKNLFCFNLICEESGLNFDNDIFDFHELMYLIPVYEKNSDNRRSRIYRLSSL